jgi:hypothetical protein
MFYIVLQSVHTTKNPLVKFKKLKETCVKKHSLLSVSALLFLRFFLHILQPTSVTKTYLAAYIKEFVPQSKPKCSIIPQEVTSIPVAALFKA